MHQRGNYVVSVNVERFQTYFKLVQSDASNLISSMSCWFLKWIINIEVGHIDCMVSSCLQLLWELYRTCWKVRTHCRFSPSLALNVQVGKMLGSEKIHPLFNKSHSILWGSERTIESTNEMANKPVDIIWKHWCQQWPVGLISQCRNLMVPAETHRSLGNNCVLTPVSLAASGSCPNLIMSRSEPASLGSDPVTLTPQLLPRLHRPLCVSVSSDSSGRFKALETPEWKNNLKAQVCGEQALQLTHISIKTSS